MNEDTVSRHRVSIKLSFLLRTLVGILLSALSAVLLVLSMPPYGIFVFSFIGFVPLILAQYRILPKKISSLAMAIAVGGLMALYIMKAFMELASAPWFMRWLPLIFGVIILLTGSGTRAFHERTKYRWLVLESSVGWVGVEMIRSLLPIMGTWGFLAYAYFKVPWLIQPVSTFGVFGLSLITTILGYALGQGALAWFDQRWRLDEDVPLVSKERARKWLLGAGFAYIGWVILSLVLLLQPMDNEIRVAALQPDYQSFFTEHERETLFLIGSRYQQISQQSYARLVSQTKEAAELGARIIVWPEGGIAFDPRYVHTADLKQLAAESDAYLVLAYAVGDRNELTILSPEGKFLGVYGKNHPVSFVGERSATHGTYPAYDTDLGEIGAIICYDMDFTDTARKVASNGADLIAVPSGDWPGIADKHYAHLVLRAAENRTAMIKVDRSYDSVIISPFGQIVSQVISTSGEQATLVADVPVVSTDTLHQTLGDWIGWASLGGMVVFTLFNMATGKKTGSNKKDLD